MRFNRDLQYAFRQLRKNTGYALFAMLILALGAGANAVMFSVINSVLVRSLPYRDASKLITLRQVDRQRRVSGSLSFADFQDLTRIWFKPGHSLRTAAYYVRSYPLHLPSAKPFMPEQ